MGRRPAKEKMCAVSILAQVKNDLSGLSRTLYMSKRELIDSICEINKTAKPEFLAGFSEEELKDYLKHLMELDLEELAVCCSLN